MVIQQGQLEELGLVEHYVTPLGNIAVQESLRLTPSWGAIWYQELDLGFPTIKEATFDYPDSDGAFDTTQHHGGRAVSLTLTVLDAAFPDFKIPGTAYLADPSWNSASSLTTMLAGWMSPNRRPMLYYRLRGQTGHKRWIDLRSSGATRPLTRDTRTTQTVQLNWISPSGKIRSFDESTATGQPDGRTRIPISSDAVVSPGNTGRTYPETFPFHYADPSAVTGSNQAIPYRGTVPNGFILRLTMQTTVVNPFINFIAPDERVQSIGLTGSFPGGTVIEFDTANRTVYQGIYSTRTPPLRLNDKLSPNSTWPQLQPGYVTTDIGTTISGNTAGINRVQLNATSGSMTAEVRYYEAHLM